MYDPKEKLISIDNQQKPFIPCPPDTQPQPRLDIDLTDYHWEDTDGDLGDDEFLI